MSPCPYLLSLVLTVLLENITATLKTRSLFLIATKKGAPGVQIAGSVLEPAGLICFDLHISNWDAWV